MGPKRGEVWCFPGYNFEDYDSKKGEPKDKLFLFLSHTDDHSNSIVVITTSQQKGRFATPQCHTGQYSEKYFFFDPDYTPFKKTTWIDVRDVAEVSWTKNNTLKRLFAIDEDLLQEVISCFITSEDLSPQFIERIQNTD